MSEGAEAVPYGPVIAKILKKTGAIERVKDWLLRRASQDVLVLGASGGGKSSFLKVLTGRNPQIARLERTTKSEVVTGKIKNSYFKLTDTPGQPGEIYQQERLRAIREASKKNGLGIINIVSYGYHEETVKFSDAVENRTAKATFLKDRRDLEIQLLGEWTTSLCGEGGAAAWVITVVTKADLWWESDDDQPVLTHYRSGPYFEALGDARSVSHDVMAFSSANQLFYGAVPMSGFYGDQQRSDHQDRLVAKMLANAGS